MSDFLIIDDFLPDPDAVRASVIAAGFDTWRPNKGEVGSSIYEGMGFVGRHADVLRQISFNLRSPVFPNTLFFRLTTQGTERAYIHSDREMGSWTCITYLSHHPENVSGTAFYRHRELGLTEMPTFAEMRERGIFEQMKREMVEGDESVWEQLAFVEGKYNRGLIFRAPLFHARCPKDGIATTPEDGRLIHATHFERE